MTASLGSARAWHAVEYDGFTLQVDPERQSPLAFAVSVAQGLASRPRRLDASYLYDARGSELFERITEQPEYYLTRAEESLLEAHGVALREAAGSSLLVELGSGASRKTRRLLDAWTGEGRSSYVAVDVDALAITEACRSLRLRYPDATRLTIRGIASTYERALGTLSGSPAMTVAFLGSSLGNLGFLEYPAFCQALAAALRPGDHFLVGLDLVKSRERLEAAYNDAAGVTAAFTRNLFTRMNRELHTRIPEAAIEHVAYYDDERERIEIFAQARCEFSIQVPALGREFRVARGERIRTEVSQKFRPAAFVAEVEQFGLRRVWTTEGNGDFGLFLFRKPKAVSPAPPVRRPALEQLAALQEARARTLQLVAPLTAEDLERQHSSLMSPIAWDLGHIAHFEQLWLLSDTDAPPISESLGPAYDAMATPRADRSKLALPTVAQVMNLLRSVRDRVERRFAAEPGKAEFGAAPGALPAGEFSLPLVIQHEAQHQETVLQAIALRDDLDYRPSFVNPTEVRPSSRAVAERVLIPGGPFLMGTDDREWAYDNERPAHERTVPSFWLARAAVTNREYLAFIGADGYSKRAVWSDAGWAWLQETKSGGPAHWRYRGAPVTVNQGPLAARNERALHDFRASVFGRLEPLHPDGIVVHVSWYEADAYARWAGGRLPSEAEWEKAAAWDPEHGCARRFPWGNAAWQPSRANIDQRRLEPARAHDYPEGQSAYGCLGMMGDVWEWTNSWFDGYQGFESFPYPEYSQEFFGTRYRVLRGGSFATRATVARNTFRNWDLPERRQIFAGFRCAWPA